MSIFLWVIVDTYVMINMTCCCLVATVFNNAYHHIDVYGDDIEVDYRGYEVGIVEILQLEICIIVNPRYNLISVHKTEGWFRSRNWYLNCTSYVWSKTTFVTKIQAILSG